MRNIKGNVWLEKTRHVYVFVYVVCICLYIYLCMYMYVYICTYIYVCIYVCICIYVCMYMYVCLLIGYMYPQRNCQKSLTKLMGAIFSQTKLAIWSIRTRVITWSLEMKGINYSVKSSPAGFLTSLHVKNLKASSK